MGNQPITLADVTAAAISIILDAAPQPVLWGVFDADQGDFVAAHTTIREAEEHADTLEMSEHDFGARGVDSAFTGRYHDRYSVDQIPADDLERWTP